MIKGLGVEYCYSGNDLDEVPVDNDQNAFSAGTAQPMGSDEGRQGHHLGERLLQQIAARGVPPERLLAQIGIFRRGIPFLRLSRPCTLGDGIAALDPEQFPDLLARHAAAAASGRLAKFVPASGAATRMFGALAALQQRPEPLILAALRARAYTDTDAGEGLRFLEELPRFAFYDQLRTALAAAGEPLETLVASGDCRKILSGLLGSEGLNLVQLPKALIPFHRRGCSGGLILTPFDEHLADAAAYTRDAGQVARLHFTVAEEHLERFESLAAAATARYREQGIALQLRLSVQRRSTDTIAVSLDNEIFFEGEEPVFRPGGHGALLANLEEMGGDIVFIQNVDNVVPDHLKATVHLYKRLLCGMLLEVQEQVFGYLRRLEAHPIDPAAVQEAAAFAGDQLSIRLPSPLAGANPEAQALFLRARLDRPLRVCGMVANQGEPGGGPFWVEGEDGSLSRQIAEFSQVDQQDPQQRQRLRDATHFNPVDLVCGVRDYRGRPYALAEFVDPNTGFISTKSMGGRPLKALELPGLWNGAMARWNTLFVEVPVSTFNPVKTVNDLLRPEHQEPE